MGRFASSPKQPTKPATRPDTYKPQTLKQAKAAYKTANGPRISEKELRQLQRAAELEERAQRIKEAEKRRKESERKRKEREAREREAKSNAGLGPATQACGWSLSQKAMKGVMEAFIRGGKGAPVARQPEGNQSEKAERDPWDESDEETLLGDMDEEKQTTKELADTLEDMFDDDIDMDALDKAHDNNALAKALQTINETEPKQADERRTGLGQVDPWDLDDIDDETLLGSPAIPESEEKEVQRESLVVKRSTSKPQPQAQPASRNTQCSSSSSGTDFPGLSQDEVKYLRLHGPIDSTIEKILSALPGTLIELLSLDRPVHPEAWQPSPELLHNLKAPSLPLHRLRIKPGCVATLLRSAGSPLMMPKGTKVKILGFAEAKLQCVVLGGQQDGARITVARTKFTGSFRGNPQQQYSRGQFPVRVCTDQSFLKTASNPSLKRKAEGQHAQRKSPCLGHTRTVESQPVGGTLSLQQNVAAVKPTARPEPRLAAQVASRNSVAIQSKSLQSTPFAHAIVMPTKSNSEPPAPPEIDLWDDFLESSSQVARELSQSEHCPKDPVSTSQHAEAARSKPPTTSISNSDTTPRAGGAGVSRGPSGSRPVSTVHPYNNHPVKQEQNVRPQMLHDLPAADPHPPINRMAKPPPKPASKPQAPPHIKSETTPASSNPPNASKSPMAPPPRPLARPHKQPSTFQRELAASRAQSRPREPLQPITRPLQPTAPGRIQPVARPAPYLPSHGIGAAVGVLRKPAVPGVRSSPVLSSSVKVEQPIKREEQVDPLPFDPMDLADLIDDDIQLTQA